MIRVYVADDHAVVRQGIIRILRQQSGLEIAGEAGTLEELTEFFSLDPCDVLLPPGGTRSWSESRAASESARSPPVWN